MRVCTPHCGLDPETRLGGEMYELEVLREMSGRGLAFDILLARHKTYPDGVPNWTVHRLPIGRGLRWPIAAFVLPPFIRRVYRATRFDLLRAHSLRYIGPAALAARAWYGVDVPIVAHHHHLDPSWLNPLIEGRVMRAVERVIVGSEFARRQASEELGVPRSNSPSSRTAWTARSRRGRDRKRSRAASGGRRADRPVLGSLEPRKNLAFLLDVWRESRVCTARPG